MDDDSYAPAFRSSDLMALFDVNCSGVLPHLFLASTSAPAVMSACAISVFPYSAA